MSIIFFSTFSISSFAIFQYVLLFLTHSFLTKASCYRPNGSASEDTPCTTNSSVEFDYCCGKDAICLTNKICLTHTGSYLRGTCTDKTWQSSNCPSFCLSVAKGGSRLSACSPLSSGTWCCETDGGDTCCAESSNIFTLGQVSIVTSKPLTSTATGSLSSSTTGDSSLSILNSASTAFASPSSTSTAVSSTSTAVSSTNTVMSSGTTIFTSVPVSSSGLSDSVKVGIGLGVPLGAIIVAQLAYLLYRIKKQMNPKTQIHGAEGQDHLQEGLTSCSHQQENLAELELHRSHQQENLAELELHQDPHELSTERQRVQ